MLIEEQYADEQSVPEDIRENFEQQEDGTFLLKLVRGLKSALTKERENVREGGRELAALKESVGTKVQAAVAERETQLKEEFSQTESGIRQSARDEANAAKKDAAAVTALQKADGNIVLMQDKVVARLAVDENGNVFVADDNGTPLLTDAGDQQTVDGLVADMRKQDVFAGAFKGTGSQGGGSLPGDGVGIGNGGGVNTDVPDRRGAMTPRQKVDFINEHGNDEYQSLPL